MYAQGQPWRVVVPGPLEMVVIKSYSEYADWRKNTVHELEERKEIERGWAQALEYTGQVGGWCYVCKKPAFFRTPVNRNASGELTPPNWRESLICTDCGLNNRLRASYHVLQGLLKPLTDAPIYITEQCTPFFRMLRERFSGVIGSEFLGGDCPLGATNSAGVRNESVVNLTFPDESFQYVISFDVLEHVPQYERALGELARILKPGGALLLTIPFDRGRPETLTRAVVGEDGQITHVLPPEYHGDPINPLGCLAYYVFGWDLIEKLESAGFDDAGVYLYWSIPFGYLGIEQILILARKASGGIPLR